MSKQTQSSRVVHWLALTTAVVSLAPIGLGALVTTLGAGMAFPDWPTSDGQGMLAYPWLQSSGDRFVEHGHRLAGVVIGLCSIALCAAAWSMRVSRSVRVGCGLILAGVVIQGVLGGARVLLDRQTIAMAHSVFGCCVFVGLWMLVSMTGRRWEPSNPVSPSRSLMALAIVFPVVCFGQYVFGGFIRHLGSMLHSHLAGAVAVAIGTCFVFAVSRATAAPDLRRKAIVVLAAVGLQVLIGLAVWVSKFGFPPAGIVAVQHSMIQVVARTLHTIAGMVVVASSVSWSVMVLRMALKVPGPVSPPLHTASA